MINIRTGSKSFLPEVFGIYCLGIETGMWLTAIDNILFLAREVIVD